LITIRSPNQREGQKCDGGFRGRPWQRRAWPLAVDGTPAASSWQSRFLMER
jgi:hypothetical protein